MTTTIEIPMPEQLDEWSVCTDCLMYIVNDDATGLSHHMTDEEVDERIAMMDKALEEAGGHAVFGAADLGFSRTSCDCCRTPLHGDRHVVVILGVRPMGETYRIIRFFSAREEPARTIKRGLTYAEASAHCNDPKNSVHGEWFDGYRKETE